MSFNGSGIFDLQFQNSALYDDGLHFTSEPPLGAGCVNSCSQDTEVVVVSSLFAGFPPPPHWAHLTVGVIMTCVGVVAISGNFFIIFIFIRFRSLRTPGNVLVPNLALADGLLALTGFPLYIYSSFHERWAFGSKGCTLYGMFGAAFGLMSINTLAAIAFERYLVIVKSYPVVRKSSRRHTFILLLFVWLNSFGWAIAPTLGWNRYVLEGYGTTCTFDYMNRSPRYRSLVMSMFTIGFLFPLAVIIYCYVYIIAFVHSIERHFSNTTEMMDAHMWRGARKLCRRTELKIARTVILNVLFFCISWLPYSAVALIGQFGDQSLLSPITSVIPGIMAKMSTMYNPFIYCFSHPRIKMKVKYLLRLKDKSGSIVPPNTDMTARENRISLYRMKSSARAVFDRKGGNPDQDTIIENKTPEQKVHSKHSHSQTSSSTPNKLRHSSTSREDPSRASRSSRSSSSKTSQSHSDIKSSINRIPKNDDSSYKNSSSYYSCSSGTASRLSDTINSNLSDTGAQSRINRFRATYSKVSSSVSIKL